MYCDESTFKNKSSIIGYNNDDNGIEIIRIFQSNTTVIFYAFLQQNLNLAAKNMKFVAENKICLFLGLFG